MKRHRRNRIKSGKKGRFYGRLFQIILLVAFTFTIYQILLEEDKTEDIYTPVNIGEELEDVGRTTKNLLAQEVEDFKSATQERLNAIDRRINELDKQVGEHDDLLEREAREELRELRAKKRELENKLDQISLDASLDINKVKQQVNTTLINIEEDLDRLFDRDNIALK
ncbi:hypothetical protein [Chondrinema litorale]|uniref:hypothetical protein n=1 Tax=Chondrinema litorale TaxID=2994555 RepID=UPI0025439174|nr:hypothetical protein [Chondrinema litorale]UZR93013.1 hypothetical protein OQ292_14220 [Chondrinema litorale]